MPRRTRHFRVFLPVAALLAASLLAGPAFADDGPDDKDKSTVHTATTLRASLLRGEEAGARPAQVVPGGPRSVPVAFGLSAVVPGLGQAYNRQWVKAAALVAAEALLIAGYTTWQGRGIDGRDAYQAYAHQYWSPVRYADWLNDYSTWLETEFGSPIAASMIDVADGLRSLDFQNPDGWTRDQQVAVRALIDQIRAVESAVYHPETGASFSHKLPYFGEQQYYELVGKYFQFAPGWSDYAAWVDADGNAIASVIDPERTGPDGSKPNVSSRFFEYADDHGTANDYLRRASRVSIFFIANHFVAAVDAAVFAKLHNDRLQPSLGVSYNAFGEPEPVARLTLTL